MLKRKGGTTGTLNIYHVVIVEAEDYKSTSNTTHTLTHIHTYKHKHSHT